MRFSILIGLVAISIALHGQSTTVDSLKRLINREGNSKKKVELLNSLSFAYFDDDIELANKSTDEALRLAQSINDKTGEGWANSYRGLYYFFSGLLPQARQHFNTSLNIARSLADINLQAYAFTQLGNVHRDKGAFDSAKYFYHQAENVLKKKPNPYYLSVVKMNEGRYYLITEKPDSALQRTQEALRMRSATNDSTAISSSWILLGNCYRNKFDLEMAEQCYKRAGLASSNGEIQIEYLQNMGEILFRRGDFRSALKNWNEVLIYHRKAHYKYALAFLLYRMGEAFEEQGYYDVATEYLTNSLRISEKAGYRFLVAETNYELSWVFYRSNSFDLALRSVKQAELIYKQLRLELGIAGCLNNRGLIEMKKLKYDSSYIHHQQSLAIRLQANNKVAISSSLFNIGELLIAQKMFRAALPYYQRGEKMDEEIGDDYGLSMYYNRIGRIHTQLERFDSAKYFLNKSIKLAIPSSAIDILRVNYADMADYLQRIGKPEDAIVFYKKFNSLTDSIFNKQTAQSLASYRALYEVERNERQIELLNKDNELNKMLLQKQRAILYSVVGGAIILLVIAAFYFRFSRQLKKLNYSLFEKNKEIAEKNEEIQVQAEELVESNQRLEERIEERTSELKQAFKELDTFFYRSSHDFRRPITTFLGLAEVARILVKDKAALELFEKVNDNALNLDKMLRKLQSVSDVDTQTLLYKEVSIREIFEMELANVHGELEKKKIKTLVSVNLPHPFYSYGALVRIIVQNLIENSVAFCAETSPIITLSANEKNHEVVLEVKDNGVGIEPEYVNRVFDMYLRANEHSKGNGLGLYIVKKTVQKLNGHVELESILNRGTTIRVFLPQHLD